MPSLKGRVLNPRWPAMQSVSTAEFSSECAQPPRRHLAAFQPLMSLLHGRDRPRHHADRPQRSFANERKMRLLTLVCFRGAYGIIELRSAATVG